MLVDPVKITNFELTNGELELNLLFWVCAAGKNAQSSARGLDRFMNESLAVYFRDRYKVRNGNVATFSDHERKLLLERHTPFQRILYLSKTQQSIPQMLKKCGIGCYNNKAKTFLQLAASNLNLRTCTVDDLEEIKGIGLKTSRCFVLHSRKNQRVACLDTHILKWLRERGHDVPKSTPTRKTYLRLEKVFLNYCDKKKVSPAKLDLAIWNKYASKSKNKVRKDGRV